MNRSKYREIVDRISKIRTMKLSQWDKKNPAPATIDETITVKQRVAAIASGRYIVADPIPEGRGWNSPSIASVIFLPEEVKYMAAKQEWTTKREEFIERLDTMISDIQDTLLLEDLASLSPLLVQLKQFEV